MSSRPGVLSTIRKGGITAEVRVFWPFSKAHPSDIEAALAEATENALDLLRADERYPNG